ncbi:methyltransferase domain-containing protein [Mycena crocata]|nr:methyltransferase domain-containing protein [Mycena crocata]
MSLLASQRSRYPLGIAVVLLIWALYLYTSAQSAHPRLRQLLKYSEEEYQDTVKQRTAMIKKYGPTPDKIESFPVHGEFYTIWDFFPPAYQCPHRVQRVGTLGDGGKYLCGMPRIATKKSCVVYSFGINGESSFEADILNRAPGCQVYGYDFSVTSFGPEIAKNPRLASRGHFFSYALGSKDMHGPADDPPTYTLHSLMKRNGHTFIDILKIDIEGSEFESLKAFFNAFATSGVLPLGQLQLEIHLAGQTKYRKFSGFLEWWEQLEKMGLRPFFSEPNLVYMNIIQGSKPDLVEYSFMNIRGDHELVFDSNFDLMHL